MLNTTYSHASKKPTSLHDVLDAFVKLETENSQKTGMKDAVFNLFLNPDRLPTNLRNFVRLQNEIAFRDDGQMIAVLLPEEISLKYEIDGARPKEPEARRKRRDFLRRFTEEVEAFFRRIWESKSGMEKLESYIDHIAEKIEHIAEHLNEINPEEAKKLEPIKESLKNTRKKIESYKEVLNDNPLPNTKKLDRIDAEIKRETEKATRTSLGLDEMHRSLSSDRRARARGASFTADFDGFAKGFTTTEEFFRRYNEAGGYHYSSQRYRTASSQGHPFSEAATGEAHTGAGDHTTAGDESASSEAPGTNSREPGAAPSSKEDIKPTSEL